MTSWLSKNRNKTIAHEIEVNVQGIFDQKFLKENFALELSKETSLGELFRLIDNKLKINLFTKFKGEFPAGWVVLLNGDRINPLVDSTIILRHQDQLSVLSALGGG